MTLAIGVKFRRNGPLSYFAAEPANLAPGDRVVAETARGPEIGEVVMAASDVADALLPAELRPVLRRATDEDLETRLRLDERAPEQIRTAKERIHAFGLDMKVIAATTSFDGLVAVINFAGGRGSLAPGQVCGESRLVEAMGLYGRSVRVPAMWLYSVNDQFFGPQLARRMHEAFVRAGGDAEFVAAPAVGMDGHSYFAYAVDDWAPRVMAFLQRVGVKR